MKKLFSFNKVLALALVFAMLFGVTSVFAEPWSFGVMSDTQWTAPTDPARTESKRCLSIDY